MDDFVQKVKQCFPPNVLEIIASNVIDPRCERFKKMKNAAPQALTSPFQVTVWPGILQADFGDFIARIRSDDPGYPNEISQIIVFPKQSLANVMFYPQRNFVSYSNEKTVTPRMVAMLAILIHRFFPQLNMSTIDYWQDTQNSKRSKWSSKLIEMFPTQKAGGKKKKPASNKNKK